MISSYPSIWSVFLPLVGKHKHGLHRLFLVLTAMCALNVRAKTMTNMTRRLKSFQLRSLTLGISTVETVTTMVASLSTLITPTHWTNRGYSTNEKNVTATTAAASTCETRPPSTRCHTRTGAVPFGSVTRAGQKLLVADGPSDT